MAPLPHPQGRGRVVALPHSSPQALAPSGWLHYPNPKIEAEWLHYPTPHGNNRDIHHLTPSLRRRVPALHISQPSFCFGLVCVPSSWSLASSQGSSPPTTSRWPGVWGVARMRRGRREASMIARVHVFKLHLRTHSRHHQAHPPPSMLVLFLRSRRRPFPPSAAAAFSGPGAPTSVVVTKWESRMMKAPT